MSFVLAACLAVLSLALSAPARAATPDQVDAALARGKEFIYSRMNPQHNWETVPQADPKGGGADVNGKQWGGHTAIAVYALLAAGENPQDPKLAPAINWLKKAPIVGHYALGLRCQMYTFLPESKQKENIGFINYDFGLLSKQIHTKGPIAGLYGYWGTGKAPGGGDADLSVSQYGVLGEWACEQAGDEVPIEYWVAIDKAWKAAQNKTPGDDAGAWPYRVTGEEATKVKATMTAAGVATLFITQDYLLQVGDWSRCRGGLPSPNIDQGLAWMDKHVTELLGGNFYGMYGVERIGVASGRKYFGTIDWYQVGSDYLVKTQKKEDGSWGGDNLPNHCFAMLFLARGRAPVVMNKLEYELDDPKLPGKKLNQPWNQRPRDVANFAHWSGRQMEQYLNWQVVNLKVSPDDLHDAPILYISGSMPLVFDDATIGKLREFVEDGGLILANADCADATFTGSIAGPEGLGKKMFKKYEFRKLEDNHVIYTNQQFKAARWKNKPEAMGMSNGVRELIIVIPEADLARAWQTRADKTKEEMFQLAQNIFLYSVDKSNLRFRGDTYIVKADPKATPTRTVKIARIEVGDNPDPEPGGWRRLATVMRNLDKIQITTVPVKLAPGAFGDAKIAHLTGTAKFKLTPEQQNEIRSFMSKGGTLIVDAAGGSTAFADAAEAELANLFGGTPGAIGEIIQPSHRVYNWPGAKVENVSYRNFVMGRISGKMNVPRVRGIEEGGRMLVFYSREDLSGGMVGQPVDGIMGYSPDTASAIMRGIVLYAANNGKVPTSQPATKPAAKPAAPPAAAVPAAAK